jgi:peptidoglycan-N-acetylglucosamine deacetylase
MTRFLVMLIISLWFAVAPVCAQRRIAFSFDDVPRNAGAFFTPDERTAKLIAALKAVGVKQVALFVNPGMLAEPQGQGGERRIAAYVAAGHVIANHSFSHPMLTKTPADAYLADIDKATDWLKPRKGYRPWFRFPFLDEGRRDKVKRDAIRAGLKARGLRNGYVTTEASDWNMEGLTLAALKAGKSVNMTALRDYYVTLHVEAANFSDELARKAIGRSPAHVMLLHETDLAALFIGDLVAGLSKEGWEIITADKAYRDPIGKVVYDTPSAQGTLTEMMAWQKGLPAPRWYHYNDTDKADAKFRRDVLGEKETP